MKAQLTPTQVREYLARLRAEGASDSTILGKVESLEQFVLFLRNKNIIATDVVNTIKSILHEYRYNNTEDVLESQPVAKKVVAVPTVQEFEQASYAGNKKTEGIAGEVHVQFHFETYKISSWLFGKLKNTPIIGRLLNTGKQNPQKTPLESTFSLSKLSIEHYIGFIMLLIFTAGLGAGLYNNFFKKTATPFAYPSTLTRGGRVISFQGRLTDTLGNPITTQTDVSFKLYSVSSGGSPLYTGSCTGVSGVSPDQDGIFDVLVGSDCSMSEISNSVFTENTNVYLGVTVGSDSEMTPRQQIANVGYAINAETLQGLPPGSEASSIPYINNQGNVLIAASNPGVRSVYTSATFTLSGANAVTLQAAGTGDVVVQATESGSLKLRTGGTTDANTRLIVTNSGNVGIGLTNPANMLAVAGGLGIGNTYAYVAAPTNGAIIQGNVGLGTTAPVEALDLNGRLRIQQTSSPVSTTDKLYNVAGNLYWSGNLVWNGANDGSGSGLDADFFDGLDSGSFLRSDTSDQFTSGTLTFNSGTTLDINSGSTLDVNGDIAIADTNIALDGASTNLNATGNFSINTNDLFVKKTDGNVGIGTTNPGQLLDIVGGSIRTDSQFISTITTGTAPLSITSTTLVTNLNADMVDGYHASQLCKSDGSDCQSLASAGGWTDGGAAVYLTTNTDKVGIGTTAPGSKLSVAGGVGIGTTSSSSVYHSAAAPDGGLIIEGNLGVGTTNPSEKLHVVGNTIITGTSDLQGTVSNSSGNLVLGDTTDIGSATTGIRVATTGSISDIDGGIQLNDAVDVTGAISNSTGSILIDDQADIGSSSNGLRINVDGNLSDINGNILLNDIVDIGSETTGINVTTAGLITDIDGNVVIADVIDLGSATTGINITTNGVISDSDGNISLNDNTDVTGNFTLTGTFSDSNSDISVADNLDPNADATYDLGDTTTSWKDLFLTGQICFDDTDCFSTAAGANSGWYDDGTVVRLLTQTDKVGIGTTIPGSKLTVSGGVGIGTTSQSSAYISAVAPDGGLIVENNVGIGTTNPAAKLDIRSSAVNTDVLRAVAFDGSRLARLVETSGGYGWFEVDDNAGVARTLFRTDNGNSYITATNLGIGTTNPGSRLSISGGVGIGTTAPGSVFHSSAAPDGGLIIEGNLGVGLTGPTAKLHVSGNAIITGTLDQQGEISNSTGNVVIADTTDIGSSTNGLNITVSGTISDIDDVITLNDAVQITGTLSDSDSNLILADTVDIGSATTGVNITTAGAISDIDGTLQLNDAVDITGQLSDSNSDLQINDNLDPASDATYDLGDTTTSWKDLYLTGQICFDDSDCFSTSPSASGWTDDGSTVRLTTAGDRVGIGTSAPGSKLSVSGGVGIGTTSSSSVFHSGAAPDGGLIVEGNVGIGLTGPTAKLHVSGNTIITGTADVQTSISNSTGNLLFDDTTDIGSSANGLRIDTDGNVSDINGNIVLNDTTDIGSATNGLNITTAGVLSDSDANLVLNDQTDIGSATTGIRVTTAGSISDIDGTLQLNDTVDITGNISDSGGNLVLDDVVDIGSATTGLNITTAGLITDIDGNVVIADVVDLGSASTGINITTAGIITDSNADVIVGDHLDPETDATYDLGDTTTSWRNLYLTGSLCFDDSDCLSSASGLGNSGWTDGGSNVYLTTNTDKVGIGTSAPGSKLSVSGGVGIGTTSSSSVYHSAAAPDGGLIVEGNVGIGTTNPNVPLHIMNGSVASLKLERSANTGYAITDYVPSGTINASNVRWFNGLIADINSYTINYNNGSNNNTVFTIKNDGNVGIGTTNPTEKLHLVGNAIITGTSDLQGAVANSTGNLLLNDTTDIGSAANGINIDTAGNISDNNANLILNDTVDIGSATTGVNVTTAGALSDIDANLVLNDTVDIGSSTNGLRVDTAGAVIDINANIVLNDVVDLGSATTGLNITTAGAISDIDGDISLSDNIAVTGTMTITGNISDPDSDLTINDDLVPQTDDLNDLGSTTASWQDLFLTGQICFDDTNCFSNSPVNETGWTDSGSSVILTTVTDNVGIGNTSPGSKLSVRGGVAIGTTGAGSVFKTAAAPDGGLVVEGNVGIGTTNPTRQLEIAGSAAGVIARIDNSLTGTTNTAGMILDRGDQANGYSLNYYYSAGSEIWQTGLRGGSDNYFIRYQDTSNPLLINSSGTVQLGSDSTGFQITSAGALSDIDANLVLDDTVDIGSSANGLRVDTAGAVIDINANIVLNDVVDLGSATTGLNVTTAGVLTDTDGTLQINDTLDVTGTISDSGSDLQIADNLDPSSDNAFDLGDTTTSWQDLFLTGQICFDDTDCTSSFATSFVQLQASTPGTQQTGNLNVSGTAITGITQTGYIVDTSNTAYGLDPAGTSNFGGYSAKITGGALLAFDAGSVGIGNTAPTSKLHVRGGVAIGTTAAGSSFKLATAPDGGLLVEGNVGIGTTAPTHKLELASHTTAAGGLAFGTDVELFRGTSNRLDLASGDSLNLVSGSLQMAATDVITSGRLHLAADGTLSGPGFAFSADTNTGIWRRGTDIMGLVTGGAENLSIIANGNVGIGSTNPGAKLEIGGSTSTISNTTGHISIMPAGNVGIGTTAPGAKLEISGATSTLSNASGNMSILPAGNLGIGTTAPTRFLDVNGDLEINLSTNSGTEGLCHSGDNAVNNALVQSCSGTPASDYMEFYSVENGIELGDIVMPGTTYITTDRNDRLAKLTKSTNEYEVRAIGVISNKDDAGDFNSVGYVIKEVDNPHPVALNGRVPVKITSRNGNIKVGDKITASSVPGVGMKATKAGWIIGTALESFDNADSSAVGKVMIFVNVGWYDPQIALNPAGELNIQAQTLNSQTATFSQATTNNFSATTAQIGQITVNSLSAIGTITSSTLTSVSGMFNSLTTQTLSALDGTLARLTITEKITSPIIETNNLVVNNTANVKNLETESISSQGDELTIDLEPTTQPNENSGKLSKLIIKGLEGKTVASIDARGNASFSGTVTANDVEAHDASISGTLDAGAVTAGSLQSDVASISGTLNAREVKADNITALENRVNEIASSSAAPQNDEEIANLNTSINDIQKLLNEIKNQPLPDPNYYQNINSNTQIPVSTDSGTLNTQNISDVKNLSLESLSVTGRTSLYDVSVANSMAVGSTLIEDGSILALTWELKFAALNQVSFFDGNVVIAKDGTITTQGTLVAKGGVHTNEIKPINENDNISVVLASTQNQQSPEKIQNSKLQIRNSEGTEVASIDASGSAKFKEIALDKYLDATNSGALIAASQNFYDNGIYAPAIETEANIAGIGLLPANSQELVIYNDKVKKDSLIYVTATSSTFDKNLFVAAKIECALNQPDCKPHFRVAITSPVSQEVKFNWWIVN